MKLTSARKGPRIDLLNGSIFSAMIIFSIPILFSCLFQELYNTVDTIIIGHVLGENALAAAGAAAPVYELLIGFALGIGNGLSLMTSRSYGLNDMDLLKRSVAVSITIGTGISLVIAVLTRFFLMPFLSLLHTPAAIIRDTYEISEFTAETFLKVYDRDGKGKNTELRFIDSDFDLPEITDDMVILGEDPEANGFQDVTEFVKTRRFNLAYGSYDDGWIDEKARIVFENGDHDGLVLRCYYPGKITGDQICRIRLNGKQMPDLVFTDNNMEYEIPAAPHQTISLEFSCNFYVKDAKERRGEDRLSMIVSMEEK